MVKRGKKIRWAPGAEQDLDLVIDYYARIESFASGERIVREIYTATEILRTQPLLWRVRPNLQPRIRAIPVEPYLVFYVVRGNSCEIVRVLHGKRDVRAIFKKMREKL